MIESIYRHPASSRADIARRTGLSRATVSTVVEELGKAHLVHEQDATDDADRQRGNGRPPTLLSLVPRAAFAVGIDIGHQHVRVTICDLAGEPIADEWSRAQVDDAPAQTLDLAHDLVRQAMRDAAVTSEQLLGVGMGVAAPINSRTGDVESDGILPGWQGIAPAAEMHRRLGFPIELANDANVGALGEKVFGAGRGVNDMTYIRLSAGVGAGLIIGGQPHQGSLGMAGEIGHVCVDPRGPICRCGNRGCLETVASPVAVTRLLEQSTGRPITFAQLLGLVASGDRGARRAVADAGEAIGMTVSWIVNILNPELVVVGGELAAAGDVLFDPIRTGIDRHSVPAAAAGVRVTGGVLGDRAEVLGAAALILAQSPLALTERVRG
ncbi:transcriptional regulator [Rugosimonospora africana]|uniref:Transcriptional regulator n=1 Tax=Rugosimonospora africana TaxID=556532 RepID=A0A8J3QQ72_9ACTN|nr:transcriptional regulator [Rugosimonospora africana]